MKTLTVFLFAMVLVFGLLGNANASLTTIGTATYMGNDYNLIYEDDSVDGGLVWLDYTKSSDQWQMQVNWASGLGGCLTVNLLPGFTTDIDWSTGWRLPLTQDQTGGFSYMEKGSEMSHLCHTSLGNIAWDLPGYGLYNTFEFNNLDNGHYYWTGTENTQYPTDAWDFLFAVGYQHYGTKDHHLLAMAVRPGTIDAVPIPSAVWLFGSGLIGLIGFRGKFRKEA